MGVGGKWDRTPEIKKCHRILTFARWRVKQAYQTVFVSHLKRTFPAVGHTPGAVPHTARVLMPALWGTHSESTYTLESQLPRGRLLAGWDSACLYGSPPLLSLPSLLALFTPSHPLLPYTTTFSSRLPSKQETEREMTEEKKKLQQDRYPFANLTTYVCFLCAGWPVILKCFSLGNRKESQS